MSDAHNDTSILDMTTQIVAAHLSHNATSTDQIPHLIHTVYTALSTTGASLHESTLSKPVPAVAIKKSVFPDYIVCLEDGKKLKMLKRHLNTAYDMTPEQYREKWGLPMDYPMVAPNYASHRSSLAKKIGLGRHSQNRHTGNGA